MVVVNFQGFQVLEKGNWSERGGGGNFQGFQIF